jgi:probable blue pigment (indigoidine) exporter
VENTVRWSLVTAIAPIAWGSTYFVAHEYIPPNHPLLGAMLRALPGGLILLALRPGRPRGSWWWKSLVLGTLNVGAFMVLIYIAAQSLPSSLASTIMALSPAVLLLLAWPLAAERPTARALAGAAIGISGACLMVFTAVTDVDPAGVAASAAAMLMSSLGYILAKRWNGEVDVLTSTAWQLVAGGLLLTPVAVAVEGWLPPLDGAAIAGYVYIAVVATAIAYAAWFSGLAHLPASSVGLIGLLNPATGVLLGTAIAGEMLSVRQVVGLVLIVVGLLFSQRIAGQRPRRPQRADRRTAAEPATAG